MGLLDFLKFAKPVTRDNSSLVTVIDINSWSDTQDMAENIQRKHLRTMYKTDDEITAATDTRMEACISTPWIIEGGDDALNAKVFEFVDKIIVDLLSYSWWAIPYGYSVVQLIWEQSGNGFTPKQVIDQPFEAFQISKNGSIFLENKPTEILRPEKFISTVRKPSYKYPMGEALFQRLYTPYYYRINGWEFWIQLLESWGKPFLHSVYEGSIEKVILDGIKNDLIKAKRPRGMLTPKNVEIKVIESAVAGSTNFNEFTDKLAQRIQRLILGQTLTSSTGEVGSLALGQVHNEVRDDKRVSDCKLLENTVNKIIGYYLSVNNISVKDSPFFKFQEIESLDKDRADRDDILKNHGVRFTKKYYIDHYNLNEEDFEVVEVQQGGFPQFSHNHDHEHLTFTQREIVNAQKKTEDSVISKTDPVFTNEELEIAIKGSKTKEELEAKLSLLIGKPSGKTEEDMTKAALMANVEGFTHASETD